MTFALKMWSKSHIWTKFELKMHFFCSKPRFSISKNLLYKRVQHSFLNKFRANHVFNTHILTSSALNMWLSCIYPYRKRKILTSKKVCVCVCRRCVGYGRVCLLGYSWLMMKIWYYNINMGYL